MVRVARGGIPRRGDSAYVIKHCDDLEHQIDCIHENPLKHGRVRAVVYWPQSSFHQHMRSGEYPPDLMWSIEVVRPLSRF